MLIIPGDKEKVKEIPVETTQTIAEKPILTPQQLESNKHDKWVEYQFDNYNGGRGKLIKMVKENLNDPSGFEYVSITRRFEGDDLIINMIYKGKNGFGGIVSQGVEARVSYKDDSVTIIE